MGEGQKPTLIRKISREPRELSYGTQDAVKNSDLKVTSIRRSAFCTGVPPVLSFHLLAL